jgi:hypothetical protein
VLAVLAGVVVSAVELGSQADPSPDLSVWGGSDGDVWPATMRYAALSAPSTTSTDKSSFRSPGVAAVSKKTSARSSMSKCGRRRSSVWGLLSIAVRLPSISLALALADTAGELSRTPARMRSASCCRA